MKYIFILLELLIINTLIYAQEDYRKKTLDNPFGDPSECAVVGCKRDFKVFLKNPSNYEVNKGPNTGTEYTYKGSFKNRNYLDTINVKMEDSVKISDEFYVEVTEYDSNFYKLDNNLHIPFKK
jgi:hypothetical protein